MKFLGDDGKFDIDNYAEGQNFTVNGFPIATSNVGEWQMPNTQSTPAPVSSTPTSSRVPRRIHLATLKVVRPDLGSNGKPKKSQFYCTYQLVCRRRSLYNKYTTKSTERNDW